MRRSLGFVMLAAIAAACTTDEAPAPGGSAGRGAGSGGVAGRSGGSGGSAGRNAGAAGANVGGSGGSSVGDGGEAGENVAPGGRTAIAGRGAGAGMGGKAGTAGTASSGASGSNGGGMAGTNAAASSCKRGIAANTAPGAAFSPRVAWWYNWAITGSESSGLEFVPMMWGKSSVSSTIPATARFLLTFNEPNFHAQSNLTAEAAAEQWPTLEPKAKAAGIPIVSPGMNFCGPAEDCNGTNPYDYLKDFFDACSDCEVDHVAVHWYNCDLPSLKDYLEPGGSLEGFEQFDKPIWLTEFSCNGDASVAEQEAFMRQAVPYLEENPHVFRYSWFSADPIPNAKLVADDGSPTALGTVYLGLARACDD